MFKSYVQKRLESYVKKYFIKHPEVKLIAVTGSVGKTGTKMAIGTVLSERFRIRMHRGNHNDVLSAPLAILGVEYPTNIRSIGQWLAVFAACKKRIDEPTDVDIIVQELGSDRIGQVPHFGTYLTPDIGVVAAVSAEHMEYFKTIDTVAAEELSVANYSKAALINKDDIEGKYAELLTNPNVNTYGTSASAEYHFDSQDYNIEDGHIGMFYAPELKDPMPATVRVIGEHSLRPITAALAVGLRFDMNTTELERGLKKIAPLSGRMNMLSGVNDTYIIDDTYNSSPLAAQSSLRVLYQLLVPQRIVVFGDMNELGSTSTAEHEELGKLCDPTQLSWVVTVGEQSKKYLAPAAKSNGCQVKSFDNALLAGAFVRGVAEDGAAILFKGSQGGIYLEEAVKEMLRSSEDESKLVRQSPQWMATKNEFFERFSK
jgi:UDP-N-acetylmuramoyl-tripeptide--D-alanyl-D-alanine ligase